MLYKNEDLCLPNTCRAKYTLICCLLKMKKILKEDLLYTVILYTYMYTWPETIPKDLASGLGIVVG